MFLKQLFYFPHDFGEVSKDTAKEVNNFNHKYYPELT